MGLFNIFKKSYPVVTTLNLASNFSTNTYNSSLAVSAVYACVRAIADPISYLPLHLYRRLADGSREKATNHPLYPVLHDEPNPDMSSLDFRHYLMQCLLLHGNAFAQIIRSPNSLQVLSLYPIDPKRVTITNTDKGLQYYVDQKPVDRSTIFHVKGLGDGIVGYSVLTHARNTLSLAATLEDYGINYFETGAKPPYVLSWDGNFRNPSDFEAFKEAWNRNHSNKEEWHKPMLLTDGMKINIIGISPEDSQFLATRKFQVAEIARWFRVPLHLLHELDRATFSNIEHQSLEFVTHCLLYWAKNIESAIHRQLLSPKDKKNYYAEFEFSGMLRGDYETRTKGYANLLDRGVLTINEVRKLENMNAVEDGDVRHIAANMARFPRQQ